MEAYLFLMLFRWRSSDCESKELAEHECKVWQWVGSGDDIPSRAAGAERELQLMYLVSSRNSQ